VGLALALIWLGHHRRIKPPGLFALYVAGYSAFRIFEEALRVDSSKYFLGLRLNMYVAIFLTLVGLAWFVRIQRRGRAEPNVAYPHGVPGETSAGEAAGATDEASVTDDAGVTQETGATGEAPAGEEVRVGGEAAEPEAAEPDATGEAGTPEPAPEKAGAAEAGDARGPAAQTG
jgi:hypothetical protein